MSLKDNREATTPDKRLGDRSFGLVFAAIFALVAGIGWAIWGVVLPWAFAASASFLAVALVLPGLLLPLNRGWSWFANGVGQLNNVLVLGLFFWLFVVPSGALRRLFGKDPMQRHYDAKASSYFTPVAPRANRQPSADMF